MVGGVTAVCAGAKRLIWEGLPARRRRGGAEGFRGHSRRREYGPAVAREAKAGGYLLAMPVEKSGQLEFDFEYGDAFRRADRGVRPRLLEGPRALQPGGRRDVNERQAELRRLSDWLHEHHRKYLFELLVPAEEAQLAEVGGDRTATTPSCAPS